MNNILNGVKGFDELLDSDLTDDEIYYTRLKDCLWQEKMYVSSINSYITMHFGMVNNCPIPFGAGTLPRPFYVPDDKEFYKIFIRKAREYKKAGNDFCNNTTIAFLVYSTILEYYKADPSDEKYIALENKLREYEQKLEQRGLYRPMRSMISSVRTDYVLSSPDYVEFEDDYLQPQEMFKNIGDYAMCVEKNAAVGSLLSFAGINSFIITSGVFIGDQKEHHCFPIFEREDGTYSILDTTTGCIGGNIENPKDGFEITLNSDMGKGEPVRYVSPQFTEEMDGTSLRLVNKSRLTE